MVKVADVPEISEVTTRGHEITVNMDFLDMPVGHKIIWAAN